jgi:8-oxo-dGTP pyrophosphatase MutT (NUDIX family)
MQIELFDMGISIEETKGLPHRTACRGIVKKDGKLLVVNQKKYDITTFPGGGLEDHETIEECCVREVLEETGIKVNVLEEKIRVKEYFLDSIWTNIYFLCEFVEDTGETNFVQEEIDTGLHSLWVTQDELMDTLENNMTLHEFGPNIHNREFLGLIHSL